MLNIVWIFQVDYALKGWVLDLLRIRLTIGKGENVLLWTKGFARFRLGGIQVFDSSVLLLFELLFCRHVERTRVSRPFSTILVLRLSRNLGVVKPLHDFNSKRRLIVHVFYIAHLRDVLLVETTAIRHA